jgi:hypothetical protein
MAVSLSALPLLSLSALVASSSDNPSACGAVWVVGRWKVHLSVLICVGLSVRPWVCVKSRGNGCLELHVGRHNGTTGPTYSGSNTPGQDAITADISLSVAVFARGKSNQACEPGYGENPDAFK